MHAAFLAAGLLRLALIVYGEWQDAHMAVKYTDVDYWVFTDAACAVADGGGSPYARATYRYTPLLAWLLLPNCWVHRAWGKLLFSAADLAAGLCILRILQRHYAQRADRALRIACAGWLFNPMVFTISTRGNAESLLCCLVLGTLYWALEGALVSAGLVFGLAVHLKLFPAIFAAPLLRYLWGEAWLAAKTPLAESASLSDADLDSDSGGLRRRGKRRSQLIHHSATSLRLRNFHGLFRRSIHLLRFGLPALLSFGASTGGMLHVYGREYLQEGFLYHLTRKDHRHNFSPYFLPFYMEAVQPLPLGSSLAAFLPQLLLLLLIGYKYGRARLPFACFLQTFVFVTFNKVCTSQYFLWYLCFLPFVYVSMRRFTAHRWLAVAGCWFGAQAVWLRLAYLLEFAGQNTYAHVWVASLFFMAVNTLVAHQFIRHSS